MPVELNNKAAKWPQMAPVERELWKNMWATSLPNDLALIEPVFRDSALQLRSTLLYLRNKQLAEQLRAPAQTAASSAAPDTEAAAINELQRRYQIGQTLLN